jgi:hypothetical protein
MPIAPIPAVTLTPVAYFPRGISWKISPCAPTDRF